MKQEEKKIYAAPQIEIIEVEVEQGFSGSGGEYPNPFGGDEIPW